MEVLSPRNLCICIYTPDLVIQREQGVNLNGALIS